MKKSKFTEAQIVFAIKQTESGVTVEEVCRKLGVSQQTFYNWKRKYGGLDPTELRRLRQLEEENSNLKKIVAELSLDKQMLQDVLKKKVLKPFQRRGAVLQLSHDYKRSVRKTCKVLLVNHSLMYYKAHGRDDLPLRRRIREIAETRIRCGHDRIDILLRREGWQDNHKRTHRVYKEEGLNLRRKRQRRSKAGAHRVEKHEPQGLHTLLSMDFVSDALYDGRRFRCLTVVDNYRRECLAIEVGKSLRGKDVGNVLEGLRILRGIVPKRIQTDNGSEFISKELDKWAYENKVAMAYSRPGKPTDNAFTESFNGSFRDECLNAHWFLSLDDAARKIDAWKEEYNNYRPHSSLNNLTPAQFIRESDPNTANPKTLPGAPTSDPMDFAATGNSPASSENSSAPTQGE
jgi:putative transposase